MDLFGSMWYRDFNIAWLPWFILFHLKMCDSDSGSKYFTKDRVCPKGVLVI